MIHLQNYHKQNKYEILWRVNKLVTSFSSVQVYPNSSSAFFLFVFDKNYFAGSRFEFNRSSTVVGSGPPTKGGGGSGGAMAFSLFAKQ